MSRIIFQARRRIPVPPMRKGTITIEPPPELPRMVPPSLLRRVLPYLIVILIVGMIVALVATGMRLISPTTLFFPFVLLLAATALYRGTDNKMRTEEVDAERADYLRYLSVVRDNVRAHAAEQRAALEWSHPDPCLLVDVPGTRRQWERDPHDPDFLVIRTGLHDAPLNAALRVKDSVNEVDLEPLSHSALRGLLDVQRTVRAVPSGIDLARVSRVTVLGEPDEVRGVLRSWIIQAVTWHDPAVLGVALVAEDIECDDWSWLKWLSHNDVPGRIDGAGPARYLTQDAAELRSLLEPLVGERAPFGTAEDVSAKHLLVVVDDPGIDPSLLVPRGGLAGVTVVQRISEPPHREQYADPERPILRVVDGRIERWQTGGWQPYVDVADHVDAATARHVARRLSRWDSNPSHARTSSAGVATFSVLLGIPDAAALDVASLWAPRSRADELRVPIGVTATGEPLIFDLKDEAEGGMGPHGLMIGMTGSGKSQTLMSILLSLLTTHSADRLIVIYADFKGEAGADIFRDFPQVVAVISNMAEKRSLADRFADTLRGEVARREQLLMQAGRRIQGSAFNSVREYEAAIAAGHDLPPLPTLLVVADEFSLMLSDHPEYADLFDYVARKGRSFRIHLLFASQTLDVGRIKDIDKNTSYRIGLKVASPAVSRQIIGVEDAFHIEAGPEHKGEGYLVPAPGAMPVKFRSTYVDGIYDPPRVEKSVVVQSVPVPQLFTARHVEAPADTVVATDPAVHEDRPPRKLIATIGQQLAQYGPKAPRLWLPPLDEPIALDELLARSDVRERQWRWPLGEIDRPFAMQRDALVFDATSAAANVLIHGGPKSGKTTALQTFIMSAAALHTPRDVTFYCLDYGGGQLRDLENLAHVGSVASPLEPERIRRTFGELEQLLRARQSRSRSGNGAADNGERDEYGETFLVIDNLYAFSRDNTDTFNTRNPLLAKVTELINTGMSYGIHVVVTTPNWLEVPLAMRDGLGLRLELKLPDPRDSNVRVTGALRRPAEAVPAEQPGRGLTMAAEHFLFATPSASDIAVINARHAGVSAPPVRLLPPDLAPRLVAPLYPAPEQVVVGEREEDLAAVSLAFDQNPLLMVFGDAKSGKTTLLRHVIRTIREHSTPDEVAFTVIDRRLHLVDEPLFPDNEYTPNIDRITPAMLGLSALLEQRRPPAGLTPAQLSGWTHRSEQDGHTHYLIVDDVDQIPDAPAVSGPFAGQRPWTSIIGLLSQASELGLRVIVTARATGSAHALMTAPLLRRLNELQAAILMMSGNPQDSGKIRGHRFRRLPPGRAMLLDDGDGPTFLQLVNPAAGAIASGPANRPTDQGREYN
ncbi:type VII secretion protein EccCa [Mycobacterium sp. IDR2000157661]|uniref:type VII secretion protein EccCa n=1 Tax=Mycobacterium sp. IDR2000157661 TaxID=2867005 RepID=UPI001EEC3116|nr:type VII secretion protein EccCa [Mycobacterium sp. IDR2000157661]ULE34410.1 type VII secretion protein EccCa [Mycobacterium sp. IDR2000157661]